MTKQRTLSAFLWLPHRSFSLLSNCLITRHRLFAKSKSKLNRRLKLALAKLAMILIIIIIERVGRASTAGTSRARTGSTASKKPSTSGCRRGRQQLANLCSSLVSSVPHCLLIAASSSHFDFGSFSLRSTLEFTNWNGGHKSAWNTWAFKWLAPQEKLFWNGRRGWGRGVCVFCIIENFGSEWKKKTLSKLYADLSGAQISCARFLALLLSIVSRKRERGGEGGRILPLLNFQWGIYLYFFVHPLLSFSVFFLVFGEQLFAYLRGRSTCYPQFVLSGSQRPLPKCSLGLPCPAGHFYSSRAQWQRRRRRRLLRRVWKKRTKRHKVCRAFAFGIQQDKHKMKCEAKAATNFQLTNFEEFLGVVMHDWEIP